VTDTDTALRAAVDEALGHVNADTPEGRAFLEGYALGRRVERAALAAARRDPEPVASAALDGAYRERNAVVAALIRSNGWKAEVVMAPDTEGWWIVYAETPQGQVSWHISPDDMDLFSDWPVAFGTHHSPWDGHTTEEKYRRLAAIRGTEAVDVERLARAILKRGWYDNDGMADALITAGGVAAEYARLADSEPS
jgi:hypothetical protein